MFRSVFILTAFTLCRLYSETATEVVASPESTTMHYEGRVLWTYQHDAAEGKPYFHPLHTTNGERLTELRPKDHPWHRGFWFSWKYLNGVNYWEENRETGQSEGFTRLLATWRSISEVQQVTFDQDLDYAPTKDGPALLRESRRLVLSPPDASGDYTIDWLSEFQAVETVEFGRTPILGEPNGKNWGGYAGLSIRLNKALIGGSFLRSDGVLNDDAIQNAKAPWMIFKSPEGAAVLMMDHPENFRSPTQWYVAPKMPFFSPAVLYDAPYSMAAGERLFLRYRLVVSSEAISLDKAEATFREWTTPARHR
ncbi:MAG TPA: PmoA family protein [Opitutales bacterium]|nr:PmoA family protein [Opitutales bacterium]